VHRCMSELDKGAQDRRKRSTRRSALKIVQQIFSPAQDFHPAVQLDTLCAIPTLVFYDLLHLASATFEKAVLQQILCLHQKGVL
jgi:hypothetical protein